MRILCISDIHSGIGNVEKIKNKFLHNDIGLVLIAGDLTNEGSARMAEKIIELLSFAKILAIPGNQDSGEVIAFLEEKGISLHKKKVKIGEYSFVGIGGGKPVNTYYRTNIGELEAKKALNELCRDEEKTIIVSHTPPFGIGLDDSYSGAKLGLRALSEFITEKKPLLCISGHVHEARGIVDVGETKCVNIGSLRDGNAAVIELGKEVSVELVEA